MLKFFYLIVVTYESLASYMEANISCGVLFFTCYNVFKISCRFLALALKHPFKLFYNDIFFYFLLAKDY